MMDNVNTQIAVTDEMMLKEYKSMYYTLNAKPDSLARAYDGKFVVTKDDLLDINDRVLEKINLSGYQGDGYIATVTVNLLNKRSIDFKNWEEFKQHNWTETSCISSIILKWNFNIRLPQYKYPQTHCLVVKITNGLTPEEMLNFIFSGNMEDFDGLAIDGMPVVARVDFIQTLLGEELLNIVGEWVEGLKKVAIQKNAVVMLFRKYRKVTARIIEYFSFILICILGSATIYNYINKIGAASLGDISLNDVSVLCMLLTGYIIVCYLAKGFTYMFARKIFNLLESYEAIYVFDITKGDRNKKIELEKNTKKTACEFCIKFILSLIFNVVCGIISSLLINQ